MFPLPNDRLNGSTVVASCYYGDDTAVVLLLNEQAPYFTVSTMLLPRLGEAGYRVETEESFPNIVPAADAYVQSGGDY